MFTQSRWFNHIWCGPSKSQPIASSVVIVEKEKKSPDSRHDACFLPVIQQRKRVKQVETKEHEHVLASWYAFAGKKNQHKRRVYLDEIDPQLVFQITTAWILPYLAI